MEKESLLLLGSALAGRGRELGEQSCLGLLAVFLLALVHVLQVGLSTCDIKVIGESLDGL